MNRIKILDTIRGACILLMIYHHTAFLMYYFGFLSRAPFFSEFTGFLNSDIYFYIWITYVSLFFVIAGITCNLSKNNFKRALPVIGAAILVTMATYIVMPDEFIFFGVLHCMAACILIYSFINLIFKNFFKSVSFFIWLALFIVSYIFLKDITIPPINILGIEQLLLIFGLSSKSVNSVDFYPIFPWIFIFFAGIKLGISIKARSFPKWFYKINISPLSFVGRYPLIIYLLHQPIAYIILFTLNKFFG